MHIENVIGLAFCHVKLDRIDLWVTTSGPLYDMILFQGIIPYEVSDAFQYISDWRIRKLLSVADYKQIQSMMPMMDEVGLVFEDPGVPYAMGGTDFRTYENLNNDSHSDNYLDLNKNETILGFIDSFPDSLYPLRSTCTHQQCQSPSPFNLPRTTSSSPPPCCARRCSSPSGRCSRKSMRAPRPYIWKF